MKLCSGCGKEKQIGQFSKNKASKDGLQGWCKECMSRANRKYAKANPAKMNERQRTWSRRNPDKITARNKRFYRANTEKMRARSRDYHIANPDHRRIYEKERFRSDLAYRMKKHLRSRMFCALRNGQKAGSAIRDLGCTIPELKAHLEARFYPNPETGEAMAWENWKHDGWHIDHIRPLSSFDLTDREQFLQACHFTNLQPLWAEENFSKHDSWVKKAA